MSVSDFLSPSCAGRSGDARFGRVDDVRLHDNSGVLSPFTNSATACADPPTGHADEVCNTDTGDVGIESLTTEQDFKPKDTATIGVIGNNISPLNGTLTFKLYKGACVPANLLDTLTSPVSGNNTYSVESASYLSALVAANANVAPGTAGTYTAGHVRG